MLTSNTSNALALALGTGPGKELKEILDLVDGPINNWFVSSVNGNSSYTGKTWTDPLDTITNALAVAQAGDRIFVGPGHVEDLGSGESIDFNVESVVVIGLGFGTKAPRIDFNHASATIDITANSVTLFNLKLRPSVATVSIGIDVNAAVTDTRLLNLEFLPGEAGDGTDEFVLGIDLKAGCDRTIIDGLRYAHHASCDGAASCIKLTGASDRVQITNCWLEITGTAAVACINGDTTLSTRIWIENCRLTSDAEPGIELLTGTTGTIRDVTIFTNLATIDAATVADGCAHFDVKYCETGNEAGTLVKTESADD